MGVVVVVLVVLALLVLVLVVLVLVLVVLALLLLVLLVLVLVVVVLVLLLRNTYCVHIATSVIRSLWVQLWYTCTISEVDYIGFRSGTIFKKCHKSTALYLSRFRRYAGENDLAGNFPLDIGGLKLATSNLVRNFGLGNTLQ